MDPDKIIGRLSKEFDIPLYDKEEDEKEIKWAMREEILVNQLTPFLERQFEYFADQDGCAELIDGLSKLNSGDEIIALSREGSHQNFQFDYGYDILSIERYGSSFRYSYKRIAYCMEGKASIESHYNIFHYLEQMIHLQSQEFPIAGSVKLAITG